MDSRIKKLGEIGRRVIVPNMEQFFSLLSIISLLGVSGVIVCKMVFDYLGRQRSSDSIKQILLIHQRRILTILIFLVIALTIFQILHQILKAANFHLNEEQRRIGIEGNFKKNVSVIEKVRSLRNTVFFSIISFVLFFFPSCFILNHLVNETTRSFTLMESAVRSISVISMCIFSLLLVCGISKLLAYLSVIISNKVDESQEKGNKLFVVARILIAIAMMPFALIELVAQALMFFVDGITDTITKCFSSDTLNEFVTNSRKVSGDGIFVDAITSLKERSRDLFLDMA